jgi:hypothetical protein
VVSRILLRASSQYNLIVHGVATQLLMFSYVVQEAQLPFYFLLGCDVNNLLDTGGPYHAVIVNPNDILCLNV